SRTAIQLIKNFAYFSLEVILVSIGADVDDRAGRRKVGNAKIRASSAPPRATTGHPQGPRASRTAMVESGDPSRRSWSVDVGRQARTELEPVNTPQSASYRYRWKQQPHALGP